MSFDLDIAIVVGFLLLNLGVGLYKSKGVTTIKEYALGDKNFTTATIIATWIGGSDFALSISETYKNGLWYILAGAGYTLNLMVVAYIFSNKIHEFKGSLSVAETMGKLYGKHVRIITALASIASTLAVVALQIKVFSTIFGYFFGISGIYATLISSFVVVIYSAVGGIKAVTFTDILQLITFGIIIPVFAVFIWKTLGSHNLIQEALESDLFNYNKLLTDNSNRSYQYISIFLCGLVLALNPTMFQRMLIAKDSQQIKKSFLLSSFVCLFIYFMTCFIGFVVFFHNPNLNPEHLGLYIIDHYSFAGIKSFALIGIMAMIMSTADSWINTASVIFSHDLCQPLGINKNRELLFSRLFAVFIGVGVVILTLIYEQLLDLLFLSENFYIPVVTTILMSAILGFRSTTRVALIAIISGIVTAIFWKNYIQPITQIESVIPGMISNFIAFFSSHYLLNEPGGWSVSKEKLENNGNTVLKKKKISQYFLELPTKLQNFSFFEYCNKHLPKSNSAYSYLSFAIFFTLITTISIEKALYYKYSYLINIVQIAVLTIATSILCNNLWNKFFKEKYLGIIWYLSVLLSLVVISSFLVLLSRFSHTSLTILTIHLTMVPLLIGWRTALVMIPVGLWLSLLFYQTYIGERFPGGIYDLKLKLIYVLFMVGGFTLTILRNKQEQQEQAETTIESLEKEVDYTRRELENVVQGLEFLENRFQDREGKLKTKEIYLKDQLKLRNIEISKLKDLKDEFIRNLPHETNTPMTGILSLSEVLYSCYDSLDEKIVKQSIKDIVSSSDRLKSFVSNIADLSKLSALTYELNKTKVDLSELVRERPVLYKKIFADDARQEFIFKVEDNIIVHCDEYYITQAIDSLISNAVKYGEGKPITINLTKTVDDKVQFKITDKGIGIPEDELYSIFNKFTVSSKTRTPAGGRGIGLALCEKIIKVHNGEIWAESKGSTGSAFYFVIPLQARL